MEIGVDGPAAGAEVDTAGGSGGKRENSEGEGAMKDKYWSTTCLKKMVS